MALTRPRYSQIPDTDYKQSVRVATTADVGNVMLAVMPNTVDGVTLNFYDRVLVRSQANGAQNGIYYVKAVGTGSNGIWERTKDASSGGVNGAVTPSIVTMVEEGTVNKNRTFKLTTTGNIDLGTTDLSFGVQAAEAAGSTGQLQFANVNNVIGGATTTSYDYITGNLVLSGNVNTSLLYQNGKRVPQITSDTTPPVNPAPGDQWYQLGTDILYEWLDDGATQYWVDVSGATIANVNPITGETIGQLTINGGQDSTSVNSGALQVVGGVGITGNLFVGGTINLPGGGSLGTELLISSNATSTSETTGALVIPTPGGIGIGGNIWAGGTIVANSRIPSTGTTTGAIVIPGIGGLGVGGNIWVGGDIAALGNITGGSIRKTTSSTPPLNPVVGDQWYQQNTDILYQYVNDGTSNYWIDVTGATVANISAYNQQSLNDIAIVSGTPSIDETTGALVVAGGVGITGNLNLVGNLAVSGGNIIAAQNVPSVDTTTGSMVITGTGGLGVGGNINVGGSTTIAGALSVAQSASFAQNVGIAANLIVSGTYFSAAGFASNNGDLYSPGFTVTGGNITATGTTATIGGLTITNGAFGDIASLGVIGSATIGGDLAVTGNITGGGLRKYAQINAPTNPVVGDVWYKTDTDVYYTYVNDGTNKYWIDYTSATVSNANPNLSQSLTDVLIVSGTPSTNTTSGALQVQGGAGITGNLYAGNISAVNVSGDIFTYANGVSILEGNQGTYSNANVTAYLIANDISVGGNLSSSGTYFTAGGLTALDGNLVATGARADIGGLVIENGAFGNLAALSVIGAATIGGDVTITGNVTGGGIRKTQSTTPPLNPVVGDLWYKTDTDVMYQYISDGTSKFWVDYVSATVSNASPTSPQSLQDLQIVSGTESTGFGSGALQVTGGASITGNAFIGNVVTGTVAANAFTYANGVSVLNGYYQGTYSNSNVTAYLAASDVSIGGNLTAGTYFSAGGISVIDGNLTATGTTATIGGLTITQGGIGDLATLGVLGAATIGGDLAVTGNITGGGIRKTSSVSAPANPVTGDQWYKTDTDTLYQYINDGTNKYWIDVAGATVSNASITSEQIAYDIVVTTDTQSTSATTGAIRVQGGIGLIGNIYATGIADFGGNVTVNNLLSNNNIQTGTLQALSNIDGNGTLNIAGVATLQDDATVGGDLSVTGNITGSSNYFSAGGLSVTAGAIQTAGLTVTAAGNIIASGDRAEIGGLVIENGSFGSIASLGVIGSATIGGDLAVTGNITGGGVNKYAQTSAPANPVPGDIWYKTDTDVYYTYVNDGTSKYWIDYVGATVSNAAVDNSTNNDFAIASGTPSTDYQTGALTVVGGVGVDGDVNISGDFAIGGTFVADAGATVGYLNVADGIDSYGNVIVHGPGTENYTVQVRAGDVADDVLGVKTSVAGGGFAIDAMNSELTGATPLGFSANTFSIGIKNSIGATVQADALKVNTAGNVSVAKTLSVGQHLAVAGNISSSNGTFTTVFADTANLTTLNLSGTLSVSTLNVTTSIDAPGIRKYAQPTAPTSPAAGDVWYKTDSDVYYTYVNDGTNTYWVDYVSATVSNAAVDNSTNNDLRIASGTESFDTDTGALTVVGGVGVVGNIFAGGIVSAQGQLRAISGVQSSSTTTGALVVTGGVGVSANLNVGGALAADSFQVAGVTNLSGNLYGTNMSLSGRADIIGAATIGGNLDITGRVTGGGIRKTTSISAPSSPVVGDLWYKTDTDVLYQYVNDGTSNYWIDYVGPTVSNASPSTGLLSDLEVVTGTSSTSTTTGAARITGGVGITENLNVGGITKLEGNLVAGSGTASTSTTTGAIVVDGGIGISGAAWIGQGANISTTLNVGSSAIVGTTLNVGANIIGAASMTLVGRADIGGDVEVSGNISGGGIRKTTSLTAPTNPIVGDLWYKTDTDVLYQYINDGSSNFWVDYVGPTVSNAAVDSSTNVDFAITSGTPSTDSSTGALRVAGGFGITGNIYADGVVSASGNIVANATTASTSTTTGALVVKGGVGISGAVYTGGLLSVTGNIAGANLNTAQINTTGNLYLGGSTSIAGRADIIGAATIGGNLDVTGAITGGGIRKTSSATAPLNPVVGDVWYKTDTDVYYTYVNDGASNYWIDYVGATVSNAAVDNSTNNDFSIASGTDSTDTSSGALTVVGGIGATGNLYLGGLLDVAGNIAGDNLSVGKITSADIAAANISATYLQTTLGASIGGNLTVAGTYFSAGGLSVTAGDITTADFSVVNGNITASGTTATIGGLTITDGSIGSLAGLSVIGDADISGNLTVTGTVTGGGIRKTTSLTAPVNPVVGDLWYKTDTDVLYQFVNDGANTYWVDYVGPTVSNAVVDSQQLNYDLVITTNTPSTDSSTGAIRVSGGVGIIGNLNVTGDIGLDGPTIITGTLDAGASTLASVDTGVLSATDITANSIVVASTVNVTGNLIGGSAYFRAGGITGTAGNLTASGTYFSAGGLSVTAGNITTANFNVTNGNIVASGQRAEIGGLVIENGSFADIASLGVIGSVDIGGDLAVTGNITGGGLRKTQSTTPPANPVQGDIWYKTDSDVYYQYISDGTSSFWVDYTSAAVANVTVSAETVGDLEIVSGTPSTDPTTGALRVAGGVGVTGDVNISSNVTVGNVIAGKVYSTGVLASSFTYPNGASILDGYYFGTYSNANVGAYLTSQGIGTADGNLTASGSYFSAGGITATAGKIETNGNIVSQGTYAKLGGLEIVNGGFASLSSLGVIGGATIGGDLSVTGNITGGGVRKTTSTTAPVNPIVGDLWYKSDTDTLYQYLNDGASTYWIDIVGAAVSNRAVERSTNEDFTIASGTLSTDIYTGALKVVGGAGITGNVYVGNNIVAGDNLTVAGTITGGDTSVGELAASGAITGLSISAGGFTAALNGLSLASVFAVTSGGNLTATGQYFAAGGLTSLAGDITGNDFSIVNGNITANGTTATIAGLTITNGSFGSVATLDVVGDATFGANVEITGDITGGGIRKTTSISAPVNPTVGDQWYKTDTDVLYEYIFDGTSKYWVDLTSASVANVTASYDNLGDLNVVGNVSVTGSFNFANGTPYITTTIANTTNIVANLSNGFDVGLDLTTTGAVPGNYGSATSIPTLVVDEFGRISSITSNAVSTTVGLQGNVGTGAVTGGGTLIVQGVANQIETTVSGSTITIGFTPNISFTDFTVTGNLVYGNNGLRTTTSATPPQDPTSGDMWYQTGTDILYRYVNDGTSEYWLDLFSTPLRAVLPERDIGGDTGEVQYNDNGAFGANINFHYDKVTSTLKVPKFRITQTQSPASPGSTGTVGEMTWDGDWIYVCVAPNTWRRAGLYSW